MLKSEINIFGMIENAFIRIVDMATNQEIMKYNLSEQYGGKTALIAGENLQT